jgi:hypothetical protein
MKTIANQDDSVIMRVSETKAKVLVEEGFRYVPKELWKEKVRDTEKPVESKSTNSKSNKVSKSTKRHERKMKKNG